MAAKNIKQKYLLKIIPVIIIVILLIVFNIGKNQIQQKLNFIDNLSPTVFSTQNTNLTMTPKPRDIQGNYPIYIGDYAFLEPDLRIRVESDFAPIWEAKWKSNKLNVTSDGKILGVIETEYPEPEKALNKQFKDILFMELAVREPVGNFGDFGIRRFNETTPILSVNSTSQNAIFEINRVFDQTKINTKTTMLIEILLTWVRVYNENGKLLLQVMPGNFHETINKSFSFSVNKTATNLEGVFDYYEPIDEKLLKDRLRPDYKDEANGYFNYYAWIKNNINWN